MADRANEFADDDSGLRSDPLFGGLTRPATVLGLPIEALLAIVGGAAVAFLLAGIMQTSLTWKLFPLGLGLVFYGIARLICAKDPRAFRYVGLMADSKWMHKPASKKTWNCGSYTPLPCRSRSEPLNVPHILWFAFLGLVLFFSVFLGLMQVIPGSAVGIVLVVLIGVGLLAEIVIGLSGRG